MFFEIVFVSLALMLLGVAICAFGYRLFVILLPLYGFFAGFIVTAQAIQQLLGGGFLATAGSWVFGFFVGLVCAVVAYFFYYAAIVILAASVGYELGAGIIANLGVNSGVIQFIVGAVLALAFIAGVLVFNLPKALIIVLTALAGAGMALAGVLVALGRVPLESLQYGVIGAFIHMSWFWMLAFLVLAACGVAVQLLTPSGYMVTPYGEEQALEQAPAPGTTISGPAASSTSSASSASGTSGTGPEGVPAT
jgi:Domain of unknown function (DUF4203)